MQTANIYAVDLYPVTNTPPIQSASDFRAVYLKMRTFLTTLIVFLV